MFVFLLLFFFFAFLQKRKGSIRQRTTTAHSSLPNVQLPLLFPPKLSHSINLTDWFQEVLLPAKQNGQIWEERRLIFSLSSPSCPCLYPSSSLASLCYSSFRALVKQHPHLLLSFLGPLLHGVPGLVVSHYLQEVWQYNNTHMTFNTNSRRWKIHFNFFYS